jgi:hypothetical protein
VEENHQHVHLGQLEKLAAAKHRFKREYHIHLPKKPKSSSPNISTWSTPSDRQPKFSSIPTPTGMMA